MRLALAVLLAAVAGFALAGRASAATLYVAPDGSDASACTDPAAPCASIDRAYHAAAPGDDVQLEAGVYPGQTVTADPTKTAPDVVVAPAPGAVVAFSGRLTLVGTSFLTVQNLTLDTGDPYNDFLVGPCNHDLDVEDVSGVRFVVEGGNTNVTFRGGSWGGYSSGEDSAIGGDPSIPVDQTCGTGVNQPSRNITFDGVTWHDVFWDSQCVAGSTTCVEVDGAHCTPEYPDDSPGGPCVEWQGAHPDCFEIDGDVDGLTIENSTFERCGDSFLAVYGDELAPVTNVTVRDNTFEDGDPFGFWSVQLSDAGHRYSCGAITFTGNTFDTNNDGDPNTDFRGGPIRIDCSGASSSVTDNHFESGSPDPTDCALLQQNATWQGNDYSLWYPCGGGATLAGAPVPPTTVALCDGAACMFSYPGPITVSIVPAVWTDPISSVLYTLDGSDPTGGTPYTAPFRVSSTEELRWIATDSAQRANGDTQDLAFDTVTLPTAQHAYTSDGTVWFSGALGGSLQLAIDWATVSGPNPTHTTFPDLSGVAGWANDAAGAYHWAPGAASPDQQVVAGLDDAGQERDDTLAFVDDSTAPTTSIACNGGPCGGTFGSPVHVQLAASDSGSGVDRIRYTLDGTDPATSATAQTASGDIALTATTTVRWVALDRVGNGATGSQTVVVDSTPPATSIQCNGGSCVAAFSGPVTVTLTATDGGAGVSGIRYTLDGSDPANGTVYSAPFTVSSTTTVRWIATDLVGNAATGTQVVTIGSVPHVTVIAPPTATVGDVVDVRVTMSGATRVTIVLPLGLWARTPAGCTRFLLTLTCSVPQVDLHALVVLPGALTVTATAGTAHAGATIQSTLPLRILGLGRVGSVLTALGGLRHQWERCTGAVCTAIPGATQPTYRLTPADAGHGIRVTSAGVASQIVTVTR
jgi:hypothetical protein